MAKAIAIIEKPQNCKDCVFGICKYWLPLSTNRQGYFCILQTKDKENFTVEDFSCQEEVHLKNCPLREVPEKKEVLKREQYEFGSIGLAFTEGYNRCIDEILGGGE